LFDRLVRRLPPADADRVTDAEQLDRFAKDLDQAAFELLVWRHGGLVLGVCRRILNDDHLAEDAFQATFLVLARKAQTLHARNVPGWLHRVARRAAHKAAKRRQKLLTRKRHSRPNRPRMLGRPTKTSDRCSTPRSAGCPSGSACRSSSVTCKTTRRPRRPGFSASRTARSCPDCRPPANASPPS
jgi:hypothetical protein